MKNKIKFSFDEIKEIARKYTELEVQSLELARNDVVEKIF